GQTQRTRGADGSHGLYTSNTACWMMTSCRTQKSISYQGSCVSPNFFNTRFAGGCRAPIFLHPPMLSGDEERACAGREISSSPDCLGLPSPPNVLPDTIT